MMDYACPAWIPAGRNNGRRLRVLHSERLRLATDAHCYVISRQIPDDLGVPLFADVIIALTAKFGSKLSELRTTQLRHLG